MDLKILKGYLSTDIQLKISKRGCWGPRGAGRYGMGALEFGGGGVFEENGQTRFSEAEPESLLELWGCLRIRMASVGNI